MAIQGLAITNKGLESFCAKEITQLLDCKTKIYPEAVVFECKNTEELLQTVYSLRTCHKVLLLLDHFDDFSLTLLEKRIGAIDLKQWISAKDSFAVRTEKDTEEFIKQEVESETGGFILNQVNAKVDLKNPQTTFFVFISEKRGYFGIDLAGEDLARRDYRIFLGTDEVKGNIAFAMLMVAGYGAEKSLMDTHCRSGVIPIEAAMFGIQQSPHFFNKEKFLFTKTPVFKPAEFEKMFAKADKERKPDTETKIFATDSDFRGVSAAKKNAKIAGVFGKINYAHSETEYLCTKHEKQSFDCIVTVPPQTSRIVSEKKISKTYEEIFKQANYLLKSNGRLVIAMKRAADLLKQHSAKFKMEQELSVMQGSEELKILCFTK
jgi:23S rRNA G2445 N2-methylase RlmL